MLPIARPLAATIALSCPTFAQQVFEEDLGLPTGPGIPSRTENVDLADVDQDGDWDAVFADGGDGGNDQNRIWINLGGLQGQALGAFADETAARLPQIQDSSRDIEFADIDGDGDVDLYVANHSDAVAQACRWWVNAGGAQAGTPGFFVDETASRWIGLGGAGSSVDPAAVLPGGGFMDWAADGDFADFDNDGDLDLIQISHGDGFDQDSPARVFLNDGDGFFTEFNPGGFQLVGAELPNGVPALWAEGLQQSETLDTTGAFADITSNGVDVDVADLDGDFDLDILLGNLSRKPRLFHNRLVEGGGALAFRDVTTAVFPVNWASELGNYEQELGDLDGDGDLDLYGLNWEAPSTGFDDRTFRNGDAGGNGTGIFQDLQNPVEGSFFDETEADFIDFENDGDLDVFVANFSSEDRLYSNDGTGLLARVVDPVPAGGQSSLDGEVADVDGDGDYDVFVAEDSLGANRLFLNRTNLPDLTAPSLPSVEQPGDRTATTGTFPLRAHVYDNAPLYLTWYNPTEVAIRIDGCAALVVPARSSGGQVFRAELPANLVGEVELTWRSSDPYGNEGQAAAVLYTGTSPFPAPAKFGAATSSVATGSAPELELLSVPFPGEFLLLGMRGGPGVSSLLAITGAPSPAPLPLPGLLVTNLLGPALLTSTGAFDNQGCRVLALPLASGLASGGTVYAQLFTFDGATNGDLLASSQGVTIAIP